MQYLYFIQLLIGQKKKENGLSKIEIQLRGVATPYSDQYSDGNQVTRQEEAAGEGRDEDDKLDDANKGYKVSPSKDQQTFSSCYV